MATLGFRDLRDSANLPALWNEEEMARIDLQSGATLAETLQELEDALALVNAEFASDPYWAGLFSVQDSVVVEQPIGSGGGRMEDLTDRSVPDPKKGSTTGWSLPLKTKGDALGWTHMGLTEAPASKIQADIQVMLTKAKNELQMSALERFFTSTAEPVGKLAGASVPLADGGTADSNYVPPSFEGQDFDSSHEHFLRIATLDMTAVNTTIAHLREHGHKAPYVITAAEADKSTWRSLSGFYAPKWDQIDFMQSATERAAFANNDDWLGVVETDDGPAFLRTTSRLPTNYFGAHKSYGPLSQMNPLRMRINPMYGYGFRVAPGQYLGAPKILAVTFAKFGYGVWDRVNGVATYINGAGDYVDPTIS